MSKGLRKLLLSIYSLKLGVSCYQTLMSILLLFRLLCLLFCCSVQRTEMLQLQGAIINCICS